MLGSVSLRSRKMLKVIQLKPSFCFSVARIPYCTSKTYGQLASALNLSKAREILFRSSEVLAEIELIYKSQGLLLFAMGTRCPHAVVALLTVQLCTALGIAVHIDYSVNGVPLDLGRVMDGPVYIIIIQIFDVNLILL